MGTATGAAQPPAPESQSGETTNLQDVATFILMGKTGVGKSSFIKSLGGRELSTGREPTVDDGIDSCTSKPAFYATMLDHSQIILVDTPGYDDSAKENLELVYDFMCTLHELTLLGVKVHGVVFLHDISETRYSGSQKKTFSILEAVVGEEQLGNVIIGTTMWSDPRHPKFRKEVKREEDIRVAHWNGIYKSTRIFYEDKDATEGIIRDLLAKPPVLLLAQTEMLKPPHSVERTTVGRLLVPEGLREFEKWKRQGGADPREMNSFEALLEKLKKPSELSFVEKLGLAITAPIILAPAALVSAPVGVVAALVHLAKKAGL